MYKLLCALSCVFPFTAYGEGVGDFITLSRVLNAGYTVRLVVDVDKCSGQPAPAMTAVTSITEAVIFKNKISSSNTHFTRNNPQFKNKSIVEFTTYTFNPDNTLIINVENLDSVTRLPLDSAHSIVCKFGDAAKIFWIT